LTSLQAAALRDVLTTLSRRAPHVPVIVYPAPVQGAGVAAKLAAMVDEASARREVDVLIVCRGGGSMKTCGHSTRKCSPRDSRKCHAGCKRCRP